MGSLRIEVWLYGPLARYAPDERRAGHACCEIALPADSTVADLLTQLGIPDAERGITFINGVLSALPDLPADRDQPLHDGDRVAFFHPKSMWPFQYRHGAALGPGLAAALERAKGPFHQTPRSTGSDT